MCAAINNDVIMMQLRKTLTCPEDSKPLYTAMNLSPCNHKINELGAKKIFGVDGVHACPVCRAVVTAYSVDQLTRSIAKLVFKLRLPEATAQKEVEVHPDVPIPAVSQTLFKEVQKKPATQLDKQPSAKKAVSQLMRQGEPFYPAGRGEFKVSDGRENSIELMNQKTDPVIKKITIERDKEDGCVTLKIQYDSQAYHWLCEYFKCSGINFPPPGWRGEYETKDPNQIRKLLDALEKENDISPEDKAMIDNFIETEGGSRLSGKEPFYPGAPGKFYLSSRSEGDIEFKNKVKNSSIKTIRLVKDQTDNGVSIRISINDVYYVYLSKYLKSFGIDLSSWCHSGYYVTRDPKQIRKLLDALKKKNDISPEDMGMINNFIETEGGSKLSGKEPFYPGKRGQFSINCEREGYVKFKNKVENSAIQKIFLAKDQADGRVLIKIQIREHYFEDLRTYLNHYGIALPSYLLGEPEDYQTKDLQQIRNLIDALEKKNDISPEDMAKMKSFIENPS
jgi:hypothetical protein